MKKILLMTREKNSSLSQITPKIKGGAVGVLPTDTIYGFVGSALDPEVHARICQLKKRRENQKFPVLIASWEQLNDLGVTLTSEQKNILKTIWAGPITAILDAPRAPSHLMAKDKTIAMRWPDKPELLELIAKAGPIVATSANITGEPFINSLQAIKERFPGLDFYAEGETNEKPSRIARIFSDGSTKRLR